jgi:MYXO-CTERM domain-containing protein
MKRYLVQRESMKRYLITTTLLTLGLPGAAHAFCGFYVGGGGADLFNNATQVVLMRQGTRTVLSMQNNYQGPPTDFAMVVPVPVVLQEENVKTLDKAIFARVDRISAPRLVEYWEQDPCPPPMPDYDRMPMSAEMPTSSAAPADETLGVTVEAQFKVGEYDIVILGATESTGLDTWLRQNKYNIPDGAEPLLRPYVQGGSKFFVAKVDIEKVQFKDGMADLSPLRFHYDAEEFVLPIRLGLINSSGKQDLIVHVLAPGQRYELANYANTTIPTNLEVKDEVRERFGEFYAALFDATVEKHPGAVVTEYAWDASTCDPCPEPPLTPADLATLGADVLVSGPGGKPQPYYGGFVLTRLHARYDKDAVPNDLVFAAAQPIVGGREVHGEGGALERGAMSSSYNTFQGRYIIRHEWTGPIACKNPRRGVWGGPPPGSSGSATPKPAVGLAFAPRGNVQLTQMVAGDVPELELEAHGPHTPYGLPPSPPKTNKGGCGCHSTGAGSLGGGLLLLAIAVLCVRRVRERS